VFHSNYGPILHRFEGIGLHWLKISNFTHPTFGRHSEGNFLEFIKIFLVRKLLSSSATPQYCFRDDPFIHFHTVSARTDRKMITVSHYGVCYTASTIELKVRAENKVFLIGRLHNFRVFIVSTYEPIVRDNFSK